MRLIIRDSAVISWALLPKTLDIKTRRTVVITTSRSSVSPVKLFRHRMQNYATLCDKIIQHYATLYNPRQYIAAYSPPYRCERPFLRR